MRDSAGQQIIKKEPFIWSSSISGRLLEEISKMAQAQAPVLILGESGTGKEHIARRIHDSSPQYNKPIVYVNCAAISQDLMESELFGHVKGAFTDASSEKSGFFERADGGSIFLDEVAELSDRAQAKLLRVLNDGEFQKVGAESVIHIDVRVIAATNRNLNEAIIQGKFRQDLYYRLAVLILDVPPLRDRPDDIDALARHFLSRIRMNEPDSPKSISSEAMEILLSYRWPGNVRELKNVIEYAALSGRGKNIIQAGDLKIDSINKRVKDYQGKPLKESILLFKKNYVREVLSAHKGNQTATAQALGIQRTYLSRLIKELAINDDEETI